MIEPVPAQVEGMFATLAPAYDRFNFLSSLGLDARWRRRVAARVRPGQRVLDLGCGTGDLALTAARRTGPAGKVTGADFAEPMLAVARAKSAASGPAASLIEWVRASADALPFADASFDIVVSAFVLRSLAGIRTAVAREAARVLSTDGTACFLELARPKGAWLGALHGLYLSTAIPVIGRLAAGRRWPGAYLTDTIREFPEPETYAEWFNGEGLRCETIERLSGGIACLLVLRKA